MGCFCLNIGITLSLPLILILHLYPITSLQILIIGFVLYLPSIAQIKFQWKPFKIFSRTCLGLGSGLFLVEALIFAPISVSGLMTRLLCLGIFYALAKITLNLRARKIHSPCFECEEGSFPYCSFKMAEMEEILSGSDLEPEPRAFLNSVVVQIKGNGEKEVRFESL